MPLSTAAGVRPEPPAEKQVSLFEIYRDTFDVLPAETPALRTAAHRLRYQVYCIENAFEPPDRNPDGLEQDEFDPHSEQAVLIHRKSGLVVGTIRAVLPRPGSSEPSLPIHRICNDPILRDPHFVPKLGELSRFAISKQFRRRTGDGAYGAVHTGDNHHQEWRRVIPHMSLGLISAALRIGALHGMEYACAVMEPSLLRLLSHFGIRFTPIGALLDYHGLRQPCYLRVADFLQQLHRHNHAVWEIVTDGGRLGGAFTEPRQIAP